MKYNSWDEAYQVLKNTGQLSEEQITSALDKAGYIKGEDNGGGEKDLSDMNIITEYKDKEGKTNSYDEKKANEGAIDFENLTGIVSSDEGENKGVDANAIIGGTALTANTIALLVQKYGAKAVKEALKKYGKKGLSLLGKGVGKVLGAAGAIYDEGQALYNESEDLKEGNIGNTGNNWKDAGQGALYNVDKMLFDVVPDKWYYNKGEQKESAKRNADAAKTDKQMKKYRNEIDRAQKEFGGDAANEANKQISILLSKTGKISPEDQNEFRADLVNKGFTIKEFKDKNGNSVYTWVDKQGKPLQSILKGK